jgi:DNA-binding response OmpR family regulator
MTRILVVEDDPKLGKLLTGDLELEGYHVTLARDGLEGLDAAKRVKPDLIVLDVTMPKMSGYDVCRALRRDGVETPIIMLTAKGQESEKVIGLDMGADDYVTKPFGGLELMARIKALLRRHKRETEKLETFEWNDIRVDFKKMEAFRGKKALPLTVKEFQILELLLRHKGDVISRERFLQDIWGYDVDLPSTRTVDNQVVTLRQKLGEKTSSIVTIHGMGYKFVG